MSTPTETEMKLAEITDKTERYLKACQIVLRATKAELEATRAELAEVKAKAVRDNQRNEKTIETLKAKLSEKEQKLCFLNKTLKALAEECD